MRPDVTVTEYCFCRSSAATKALSPLSSITLSFGMPMPREMRRKDCKVVAGPGGFHVPAGHGIVTCFLMILGDRTQCLRSVAKGAA